MVKRSRVTFSEVKVGDKVTVPIPSVDHGRRHPRNIIGIIIAVSETNMYTIAVEGGVLNGRYSRNQFDECATSLFSMDDFYNDKQVSLRIAAHQESNCGARDMLNVIVPDQTYVKATNVNVSRSR